MPADLLILLLAIVTGAAIQVGVGIGFSIVAAPVMMVLLGYGGQRGTTSR